MREKRYITAPTVTEYNEITKLINKNEIAFFVTGNVREEILNKAKKDKKDSKGLRKTGKFMVFLGVAGAWIVNPIFGAIVGGIGGIEYLSGKFSEDFKKYAITENQEKERLEFVRVKGSNAFNKEYDTIVNY